LNGGPLDTERLENQNRAPNRHPQRVGFIGSNGAQGQNRTADEKVDNYVIRPGSRRIKKSPPGSLRLVLVDARSSLDIVNLMPSTVIRQALASSGDEPLSPSQVAHSSMARNAGIQSDSACSLVRVRISASAGAVWRRTFPSIRPSLEVPMADRHPRYLRTASVHQNPSLFPSESAMP
jgi:hypothetical protein